MIGDICWSPGLGMGGLVRMEVSEKEDVEMESHGPFYWMKWNPMD